MIPSLLVLLALAPGPLIRGAGEGGCPSADEVSARLGGLLGTAPEAGPAEVLEMGPDPAGLRLRLWRADGTLVAERTIARAASCAEMAEATAVLVAAWEADLRPGTTRMPLREAVAAPVSPATAAYELGVVPAVWLGGGGPALGGVVRGGIWSRRAPLGMTVAAAAAYPTSSAGDGWARWRRYALSGGVIGRLQRGTLFIDALAETVLGWLVARDDDAGDPGAAFDPGLSLAVRAGRPLAPHLEGAVSLGVWGAALRLNRAGAMVQPGVVPRWGLLVGVGVSARFGE